ncbi:MAG: hypothetical protein ACR2N3_03330 [Pyrinomonadaceae bacterium]
MKLQNKTLFLLTKSIIGTLLPLLLLPCISSAQNSPQCQPPETDVAVYDFVPEQQLQTGDFRALMKTETVFVQKLREAESFNVSDFTMPIPSADIQPEPPQISGNLELPPAQIQESYFFVGQITKTGSGFLLAVQRID